MTARLVTQPAGAGASRPALTVLPVGSAAVLVEPPDARNVVELYLRLRATAPAGVTDLVPAATTVLVGFEPGTQSRVAVVEWIRRVGAEEPRAAPEEVGASAGPLREADIGAGADAATRLAAEPERGAIVELPLRYDGPDLAVVAELTGASVDEVIGAHLEQVWTAAFIGFAPGFAYLAGEDDRLTVPRRVTPRAAVPAGSVALAAGYCGVYPRESPGGWHVIGHTAAVLWDAQRADPALLAPGTRVRFVREG
ncbi:5-oxoprolinase subunit B family protein [Herbiconiux ginsengi]|uniref:Sensor histidine kinase inhibitor, KipI family n=1 Tax=Herbiconiux ginsengi TaxID=381665 RepID=A0A1H3PU40_9MICO|nr:allophanate hydrolase subunit 1 [Herbiconiux ginsengi]SDZ04822.1 sensor histidine kinase inhibitor, KipI family [Herbiconiux ginsengi]